MRSFYKIRQVSLSWFHLHTLPRRCIFVSTGKADKDSFQENVCSLKERLKVVVEDESVGSKPLTHSQRRRAKREMENKRREEDTLKYQQEVVKNRAGREREMKERRLHAKSDFVSDQKDLASDERKARVQDQALRRFEPKIDPKSTSILLFPGQGSQYVGMGKGLLDYPQVRTMYERASTVLGYDLLDLCLNGPEESLRKTIYCQPAVVVTALAAVQKIKAENPEVLTNCVASIGYSVGEFSALVFSGALEFDEAIELVRVRAEAMQYETENCPGGLLAVMTGPKSKLGLAIQTASEYCRNRLNMPFAECSTASYLFSECKVIGGHMEAIDFLEMNAREFGLKWVRRVPVSGAFHTPLMKGASVPLREALNEANIKVPLIPTYSNVEPVKYHTTNQIKKMLSQQVCRPVMWEQLMHAVYSRKIGAEFPKTYETGPGEQLSGLLKRTNAIAYEHCHCVDQ